MGVRFMSNNKEIKYPLKSKRYKGVFQRKGGKWFYRIKKVDSCGIARCYQESGYDSEEDAYKERLRKLRDLSDLFESEGVMFDIDKANSNITFGEVFKEFLSSGFIDSQSSIKKYQDLYNSQLAYLEKVELKMIDVDIIDLLLLKLSLKELHKKDKDGNDITVRGYSDTYIASVRKLLNLFFEYTQWYGYNHYNPMADRTTQKYKLRVLTLFSGIGAPEQALKNLGVDYDLIKYCEIDKNVSKAYSMLHNEPESKNMWDIISTSKEVLLPVYNIIHKGMFSEEVKNRLRIPNYDLLIFGFPCTNMSSAGDKSGFKGEESRLFFNAMEIVFMTNPKFVIIENVPTLLKNENRHKDLELMYEQFEDNSLTYYWYEKVLNAKDFGLPQKRERAFWVLIREDVAIEYKFPKPIPLTVRAENFYEDNVNEEYFLTKKQEGYIIDRDSFAPNDETNIIPTITTGWGNTSYSRQTILKVEDRYRCLTSTELMQLQGFEKEQATLLRTEFNKELVGHFVGNSIAVPVIQAIIKSLIDSITEDKKDRPKKSYIMPLFSYMGNKYRLMRNIDKYLPKDIDKMTFVDLFSGSATVPINVSAKKYILNDTDQNLIRIYKALATTKPDKAWAMVMGIVNEYDLSADNPEGYYQCRKDYIKFKKDNSVREKSLLKEIDTLDENTINEEKAAIKQNKEKECYWLLALIYHSFNTSTVQYNQKGEYNAPFGKFKCNIENAKKRFYPFANRIYRSGFSFECRDFRKIIEKYMTEKTKEKNVFFYVDPPYICGTATYNKNWSEEDERDLYALLEECDKAGVKWMLSNVLKNKKKENTILKEWLENAGKKYKVHYVQRDYSYNTYCRDNKGKTKEVIITNY